MSTLSTRIALSIAGVRFTVVSDSGPIAPSGDPLQAEFLEADAAPAGEPPFRRCAIRLVSGSMPGVGSFQRVFDGGSSWSMFRDGGGRRYVVKWHGRVRRRPLWTARLEPDLDEVTVFCASELGCDVDGERAIRSPVAYPLDQILLMHILAGEGGAMLHAAGVAGEGGACLLSGRSGAGKSTLAKLAAAAGLAVLSDDRVAVREAGAAFYAWGTPWPGTARIAVNRKAPIAGIFVLEHGARTGIASLSRREAFERLLPTLSVPWYDAELTTRVLGFCEKLLRSVPVRRLRFRPDVEAVRRLGEWVGSRR